VVTRWLRRRDLAILVAGAVIVTACSSSTKPRASTTTTTAPPVATLTQQREVSPLYSQGLAHIPNGWIFSGTDWLARTDDALHQTLINTRAIPAAWTARGYDHIGDIDVIGNVIYAPFEEPNYKLGHQATATYDATTLRFISAVTLPQHQNSFVTVDPTTMIAYSMDEFGGAALLRYDVTHAWKPLTPLKMSHFVDQVQGADVAEGAVWLSTDDATKSLYRVDLGSGRVDRLASQGFPKGEAEGIDATALPSGLIHALIVAGVITPVYLHDYRVVENRP
jgi:hypothetical protein